MEMLFGVPQHSFLVQDGDVETPPTKNSTKILTRINEQTMYFHVLKTKQNEQIELLEMRGAFSFVICTNPILFFLNNQTYFIH